MTTLNISPEVIQALLTSGIVLFGAILIGWEGIKKKVNLYSFFFGSFFAWAVNFLFYGLSRMTLDKTMAIFQYINIVISFLFLIIAIDYAMKERISSVKMLIFGILGAFVTYFAFLPESLVDYVWGGYPSFKWHGMLELSGSLMILLYGLLLSYFSFLTYIKSPDYLKSNALILLIGSLIIGIVGVIITVFTDQIFPAAIGMIVMAVAFAREPKIFFVLPYKVDRLTVIQTKSGITLFDYKWVESEIQDLLLGGLLQGVKNISLEVLKKGEIKEIVLAHGTLLFYLDKNITIGLLVSKTSKYLKKCLEQFSVAFEKKYKKELTLAVEFVEASRFDQASDLVNFYFPHIPSETNQFE